MKRVSRQRGAIGLFGILTLLLAILFTAVAVDTGRLMMQQRHLQTVADMAALDASSQTGHCGNGDFSAIQALANASAERNKHTGQPLTVSVGEISVNNGIREFSETPVATATAVMVEARKTVPASLFVGGILGHQTTLQAEAVAERDAIAGFSAGTTLTSLSEKEGALLNALLGSLLGSPVKLDVLSYEGIAKTRLSLKDLVDASADIGTVQQLLDAELSVTQLLALYANAVSMNDAADVNVMTGMNSLIAANVSNLNVALAEVVGVSTPTAIGAANAKISLLDLLITSLMVANGSNALNLPVSVLLPSGLLNLTTKLQLIEPPQIAIGPPGIDKNGQWKTVVKTAQVRLNTGVKSNINLTVAGLVGVKAAIDLGLQVEVAQGAAWLKRIQCSSGQNPQNVVTIAAQPGVASVNLINATGSGTDSATIGLSAVLALIPVPIAEVGIGLNLPVQNNYATELDYNVAIGGSDLPQVQRADTGFGASLGNLAGSLDIDVTLLGVVKLPLLDQLLADAVLSQIMSPLLAGLGDSLIDPLLSILGIEMGVIDVQLDSVEISRPELKR